MPKITEHQNNQLRITIPRKLALAIDLKKGDEIEFMINGKGRLEMVKNEGIDR
jgi:bifunctional DNA-binding transcriptional regulator/antitoxin component of YhaV-PrlF toxin-antitoxin module